MRGSRSFALITACAVLGATGLAMAQAARTPAELALYRQEQMRRVGAAFKGIMEETRRREPNFVELRTMALTLSQLSQDAPNWFPAGSGRPVGEKNRAKPEIWSNSQRFAQELRQLQTATAALAGASDLEGFRTQFRAVAPSCTRCHDAFTVDE